MRKKSNRKVRPLMNPITLAIEGAAIATQSSLNALRARELSGIDAFARGQATEVEWDDILAMLCICEDMAKAGIGPEALEACQRGREHLAADKARFLQTGRMGTTGPGLQAYRDVFEYHDIQRQSIARSEYEKYIQKSINKVKTRKAGTPDRTPAR